MFRPLQSPETHSLRLQGIFPLSPLTCPLLYPTDPKMGPWSLAVVGGGHNLRHVTL